MYRNARRQEKLGRAQVGGNEFPIMVIESGQSKFTVSKE